MLVEMHGESTCPVLPSGITTDQNEVVDVKEVTDVKVGAEDEGEIRV